MNVGNMLQRRLYRNSMLATEIASMRDSVLVNLTWMPLTTAALPVSVIGRDRNVSIKQAASALDVLGNSKNQSSYTETCEECRQLRNITLSYGS